MSNSEKIRRADARLTTNYLRYIFTASVCICFTAFFIFGPMKQLSIHSSSDAICTLLISLIILVATAVFFIHCVGVGSDVVFVSLLAIAAAALALRLYFFNEQSNDYNAFLSGWISQMRQLPALEPITTPIGDYNMPYLYFLFSFSRTNLYDLYLIKLLSVVFDFVLATGIVKLVKRFHEGDGTVLAAFTAALFIPTVFLNSAYWAQCDGIYAALCVWALYFALSNRPRASVIFFAFAFSFKIQTIFILPIIIFLLLRHKIALKHLPLFPLTFALTLLPALICGRSFYDTFSIYIDQTASYPSLTLNCPTLWALFPEEKFETFGNAALFLAGAAVLAFGVYLYLKRSALTDKLLFDAAYLFTLLLPFLLPRMHERYFYLAEVLTVVYMLLHRKRLFIPPLVILTSFSCYCAYLFGYRIFSLLELAIINFAVIFWLLKKFTEDISAQNNFSACATTEAYKER